MREDVLTDAELDLLERLPGPPALAEIRTTTVWIIEWLSPGERKTGKLLHDWMQERRPGWSAHFLCESKVDVLAAIDRATIHAQQSKMIPVLHLEAHGNENGISPDNTGISLLAWDQLTTPLQRLNIATGCNLVVFVAACTGFAAIKTFSRGPRAPALALVGPDRTLLGSDLLWGTKEFYRRWIDGCPKLDDMAESASREVEPAAFGLEPFATLAFDAMAESLIRSIRPCEQHRRMEKVQQRMRALNGASETEIERELSLLPPILPAPPLQRTWDELFMIDLYPANRVRFGVDMAAIVEMLLKQHKWSSCKST